MASLAGSLTTAIQAIDLAPPDKQPPLLPIPPSPGKKLGVAIVGIGELALTQVLPAFAHSKHCRPTALVSGHPDKARVVAGAYGIEFKNIYNYENYDSIKNNPDIDIVYIILPNSMHAEYTLRGFKAGKHVLCEKPMAVNVDECRQMIDAGGHAGKKLMIAYRLQYEPFNQTMIELSRAQAYGPIRLFEADNIQDVKAPNIRLSKKLAGGPVGDVGIYCLNAARYIAGGEPVEVNAMAHRPANDPRFEEVPATVVFQLRFPSGMLANCSCGFDGAASRRYRVFARDGWYELDPAFDYTGLRLHLGTAKGREELTIAQVNQFAAEMDHFAECILGNKVPRTPGEEGMKDIAIIAKINEAAETGKMVKII